MSFLVVANFKSNKTIAEVQSWLGIVKPIPDLVVAPSFPHLSLFSGALGHWSTGKHICAQDISPFPPGSYTGAVNAKQLKDLGVTFAIVGHSERRRNFHETSVEIAGKVRELISEGINPIVCLEEKDITSQFAALDSDHYDKCRFCFEPADIIGGTEIASLEEIESVRAKVKSYAPTAPFMYGGSVNEGNIEKLLSLNLDGSIISSACLDPQNFNSLLKKIDHAKI